MCPFCCFFNRTAKANECTRILNDFPQIYCVFLFCCTASLFGTIISQINEIVAAQASMIKELDRVLEAYLAVQPK